METTPDDKKPSPTVYQRGRSGRKPRSRQRCSGYLGKKLSVAHPAVPRFKIKVITKITDEEKKIVYLDPSE